MAQTTTQSSLSNSSSAAHAAYDEVPYISHAFAQTNPLLLQGIAKLFGLNVPSPAKARILEIGCASGNNIISIASRYPQSQCVGIDYSQKQITAGMAQVKELELANLSLNHMSVMDVTKDFGTFDYIICHGVLSWVTSDVQEKILEVCSANLSEDGVAFVSYNTLPGWNNVRSVRDMMLYHTSRFDDAPTKAHQARQLLKFVGDAMKANNNPMADFFERELVLLNPHPDAYLLHDHLEENNFPFYFHELMARADKHELQYLADTSLETMFAGNFSADVAKVLATSDDIVRTEQYMDYIYNRRFRNTLLCHKGRILSRNIQASILKGAYVVANFIYPDGFKDHDITSLQQMQFKAPNGMVLTTNDPASLALMQALMESQSAPNSIESLVDEVRNKLEKTKCAYNGATLEDQMGLNLIRYMFLGATHLFLEKPPYVSTVSKKPRVSKLARQQAPKNTMVSGLRQDSLQIEPFDNLLIPYVDGTHTEDDLLKLMLTHFVAKELTMNNNGTPIEDLAGIRERLGPVISEKLQRYAQIGLLEA